MKIHDLITALEALNIPVANTRFLGEKQTPFLVYFDASSENFGADNIVYHENINVDIELYTETIDDDLEARLKKIFTDNEIYYEWDRSWIQSEKVYKTIYEVTI